MASPLKFKTVSPSKLGSATTNRSENVSYTTMPALLCPEKEAIRVMIKSELETIRRACAIDGDVIGAEALAAIPNLPPGMTDEEIGTLLDKGRTRYAIKKILTTYNMALAIVKTNEQINVVARLVMDPNMAAQPQRGRVDLPATALDAGRPLGTPNSYYTRANAPALLSNIMGLLQWCGMLCWMNIQSNGTRTWHPIDNMRVYSEITVDSHYNPGVFMMVKQQIGLAQYRRESKPMYPPWVDVDASKISENYLVLMIPGRSEQVVHQFDIVNYYVADHANNLDISKSRLIPSKSEFLRTIAEWKNGTSTRKPPEFSYQVKVTLRTLASMVTCMSKMADFPIDYPQILRHYSGLAAFDPRAPNYIGNFSLLLFSIPRLLLKTLVWSSNVMPQHAAVMALVTNLVAQMIYRSNPKTSRMGTNSDLAIELNLHTEPNVHARNLRTFFDLFEIYRLESFTTSIEPARMQGFDMVAVPQSGFYWLWEYMFDTKNEASIQAYAFLLHWWARSAGLELTQSQIFLRIGLMKCMFIQERKGECPKYIGSRGLQNLFLQTLHVQLGDQIGTVSDIAKLQAYVHAIVRNIPSQQNPLMNIMLTTFTLVYRSHGPGGIIHYNGDQRTWYKDDIIAVTLLYSTTSALIDESCLVEPPDRVLRKQLVGFYVSKSSDFALVVLMNTAQLVEELEQELLLSNAFIQHTQAYVVLNTADAVHGLLRFDWIWTSPKTTTLRAFMYYDLVHFLPILDSYARADNLAKMSVNFIISDFMHYKALVDSDELALQQNPMADQTGMARRVLLLTRITALIENWNGLRAYDPVLFQQYAWTEDWLTANEQHMERMRPIIHDSRYGTRIPDFRDIMLDTLAHLQHELNNGERSDIDDLEQEIAFLNYRTQHAHMEYKAALTQDLITNTHAHTWLEPI